MSRIILVLFTAILGIAIAQQQQQQPQKSRRPAPTFKKKVAGLELPNNATSIRENIVDTFSCENRIYGYYADMDNDCQIFHICLPQARTSVRFSFICPAETVFNQATFVCTQTESSIPCEESEKYYELNEALGKVDENSVQSSTDSQGNDNESATTSASNQSLKPTRLASGAQAGSTAYPPKRSTRSTSNPKSISDQSINPSQGKRRRQ